MNGPGGYIMLSKSTENDKYWILYVDTHMWNLKNLKKKEYNNTKGDPQTWETN